MKPKATLRTSMLFMFPSTSLHAEIYEILGVYAHHEIQHFVAGILSQADSFLDRHGSVHCINSFPAVNYYHQANLSTKKIHNEKTYRIYFGLG